METTDPTSGSGSSPLGRPVERVLLAAVVVVAAALRWHWLGQPIRYDEAVTWLEYASRPLPQALALYDLPNNHLFHTLLVHLSTDVLGPGVRALRLPAFLAGVLTVPAAWALGRRLHGPATGLVAAAAVAASPVLVLFSTNARGYALVVLAFLLLALLATELRRRASLPLWAAFSAVAALAGWTMPAALYPAVAAGAWLVWPARPGEGARPQADRAVGLAGAAATAAGVTAVLYLPVLRGSGWRSVVANRFVAPDPPSEFVAEVPDFLAAVLREWGHGVPGWIVVLFVAGAAAALARGAVDGAARQGQRRRRRDRRARPPPLLPAALIGSAVVLAATRRVPFARVWLYLLPAFLVFASAGIGMLARALVEVAPGRPASAGPGGTTGTADRRAARAVAAAALTVLVGGGVHLMRADPVTAWGLTGSLPAGDRVAALLHRRMGPEDAVHAPLPSDAPLEYYFSRLGRDRDRVDDVPGPGGCLWIVVNRTHGEDDRPPGLRARREGPVTGRARLVRDFGGSAVYVEPPRPVGAGPERGEGSARPDGRRRSPCGAAGGDGDGAGTDSPGQPPARGGTEPSER